MLGADDRLDIPPNVEVAPHFHLPGLARFNEVIQNLVHRALVKDGNIAVRVEIELQGLELDARVARLVLDMDYAEIGKPAARAKGRPLRARELNIIAP